MKHTALPLAALLALPLLFGSATAMASPEADHSVAKNDIVTTAVADGRFQVLAAALTQADLITTLRGEGPFTVFAPTDEAFAALPDGVVADLLRPENKASLQRILTAHVVSGRVHAADLLPASSVKTLAGASFPLGLRMGGATVTQADVACANGVIHVIDAVLIPSAPTAESKPMDAHAVLHAAIEKGVPMYNNGDEAGCAAVYHEAAKQLMGASRDSITDLARHDLKRVVANAPMDPSKHAWALRHVFDRMLSDMEFTPREEASLPVGFPKAGPIGQVMRKQYPQYRAARATGEVQGGSFWTLFQHIKKNNVEMTAPVEMSMDGNMRMKAMAFLYEGPTQGSTGKQGSVDVVDLPSVDVLSVAMRGRRSSKDVQTAKTLVEARMTELGLTANGDWRLMGYSSPMVGASNQYWELQIPVLAKP